LSKSNKYIESVWKKGLCDTTVALTQPLKNKELPMIAPLEGIGPGILCAYPADDRISAITMNRPALFTTKDLLLLKYKI
jgi:hypothetical protein